MGVSTRLLLTVALVSCQLLGWSGGRQLKELKTRHVDMKSATCNLAFSVPRTKSCDHNICQIDSEVFKEKGAFTDRDRASSVCHAYVPDEATAVHVPCVTDTLENAKHHLRWEKCMTSGVCIPLWEVVGNASERGYSFLVETMANYTCNITGLPPKLEAFPEAWSNTLVIHHMMASFSGVYRCSLGSKMPEVTHQYIIELEDFTCKTCFQETSPCHSVDAVMPTNFEALARTAHPSDLQQPLTITKEFLLSEGEEFCLTLRGLSENSTSGGFVYSGPYTDYRSLSLTSVGVSKDTLVNRIPGVTVHGSKLQCFRISGMTAELAGIWEYKLDSGFTVMVIKLGMDVKATPWRHADTGLVSASGAIFVVLSITIIAVIVRVKRKWRSDRRTREEQEALNAEGTVNPVQPMPTDDGDSNSGGSRRSSSSVIPRTSSSEGLRSSSDLDSSQSPPHVPKSNQASRGGGRRTTSPPIKADKPATRPSSKKGKSNALGSAGTLEGSSLTNMGASHPKSYGATEGRETAA